jgi:hypothetical protein
VWKQRWMGWVVTGLRTEALEALVDERAREQARAVVADAERDARRRSRAAARETADAAAYLDVLEALAVDTRRQVAGERRRLREARPASGPPPTPPTPPEDPAREIRVRPGRASLRESPLAELFRATAAP